MINENYHENNHETTLQEQQNENYHENYHQQKTLQQPQQIKQLEQIACTCFFLPARRPRWTPAASSCGTQGVAGGAAPDCGV